MSTFASKATRRCGSPIRGASARSCGSPTRPSATRSSQGLGLEPLDAAFTGDALHAAARGRKVAVKTFLMNSRIVTGVGNIYAAEALFRARVHPLACAGRISAARWKRIADAVRATLERAVERGGTTLRDFASADGAPGHFLPECAVYGREGKPCPKCRAPVRAIRQGQRSTFYCPACQR
jgi:formamidopyrimidine-DNA glycosylase